MDLYKEVTVTYDGKNRIEAKGEGIKIVLIISQSELTSVYMGSEGRAKIIVTEK